MALPTSRGPRGGDPDGDLDDERIVEGELMPDARAAASEQIAGLSRLIARPLDILWTISLLVTGWLLWLALHDADGVIDILLGLLLALPFALLSMARLGLWWMGRALRKAREDIRNPLQSAFGSGDMRFNASDLGGFMNNMRHQAVDWAREPLRAADMAGSLFERASSLAGSLMLTPFFFAALAFSLLATLVMIPVALFTLLFALF
ncbi:MAG: hypothetical protein ACOZAQ_10230 [Pseudomonadota bacterium]